MLDAGAFRRYWDAVVEPLIADAGPLAGTALKYLHTDSWEVEPLNWTPTLREEFQQRRGYDLLPWLPVLAGRIVESRDASNRFLHDFRKTLGDLAIDNHYRPFRDGAHQHGLQIHPESGGPHAVPIDAQRCLGFNDVPMSEFWAWSWRHRIGDDNRFFVKQPASAAHTYGRRFVAAEGFTTIGPHWQETLWDNLKPSFDKACCEGLNLLVWHEFVCSPAEHGLPGIQYFAGTHLNPNVTWWSKSEPFFGYINRCQFMLQQGLFVADACYYYGDHVPNFAQHKRTDPAHVLPGYDYDVITEEALLTRASVQDGRIVLPDGMSYRVLVLRDHQAISLPVLRKVNELVEAGATVVGPKPTEAMSLQDSDAEVKQIADSLWDQGRVVADKTAREVLLAAGVKPDFEFSGGDAETDLDYIHRRDGETDIYFVANRGNRAESVTCTFRVAGKAPELWDPVSGSRRFAAAYTEADGRTSLPLEFAPCGSWFVVFREPAEKHPATAQTQRHAMLDAERTQRPVAGDIRSAVGRAGNRGVPRPGELARARRAGHQVLFGHGGLPEDVRIARRFTVLPGRPTPLARSRQRPRTGRSQSQRPILRHHLVAAVPRGHQRRGEARREPTGNRGGELLAEPDHRRRRVAAGAATDPDQHPQTHQRHQTHGVRTVRAGHVAGSDNDPRPEEGNAMNNSSTGSCAKAPLSRRPHESTHRMLNPDKSGQCVPRRRVAG